MKKFTITLFTLLFFATVSYAQELSSKIKSSSEGGKPSTTEISKDEIPKVSTFVRMNNFTSFQPGEIVYDTNLEAYYQYMGDNTWIVSDKFSPKKSSSFLSQLSSLSTVSGAPTNGLPTLNISTGTGNTFYGDQALYSNTTGSNNNAIGYSALYSNTTGNSNTANGIRALYSNTRGAYNTANGSGALYSNTTGNDNTANGFLALYSNTTGTANTANGFQALYLNATGSANTANGHWALYSNTSGAYNNAIGHYALYSNTTGNNNTALGVAAGRNLIEGNKNIAIGDSTYFPTSNGSYQLNIGNEIYGLNVNSPTSEALIGIGTNAPTATLDVNGSLRIRGGSPGAGKVLTSDANGNASWESASGGIYSGSGVIRENTTVDIGTNSLSFFGIGGTSGKSFNIENTSGDGKPALRVFGTSPSNGWNQIAHFMMPNMVNGGKNMIGIGKSWSKLNTAYLYYYHASDGSTNNQIRLGFHSSDDIVSIGADKITSIKGKTYINNDNNDKATITATPGQVEFVIYLNIGTGNNQGLASQGITTNGYDLQFEGGKYEVTASLGLGGIFKQYVYPMNITIGYATDYISGTGVSDNKISFDFNTYTHQDGTHFDSGWKTFFPLNPQQKYRIFLTTYNRGGDKINVDTLVVKFRRIG